MSTTSSLATNQPLTYHAFSTPQGQLVRALSYHQPGIIPLPHLKGELTIPGAGEHYISGHLRSFPVGSHLMLLSANTEKATVDVLVISPCFNAMFTVSASILAETYRENGESLLETVVAALAV